VAFFVGLAPDWLGWREDTMADDLENTIRENAQGPAEAKDDAGSFKAHNLKDQIEADKYLSAKTAGQSRGLGIRIGKIRPSGAI